MADSADVPCSYTDTDADASISRPKVDFNPVPTYIRDSLLAAKRQLVDDPPRTGDEHQWSTAFSTPVASVNVSAPYSRCFEDSVLLSNSGIRPEDVNAAAEAPWNCDHCFVKHAVQVIGKDNTDFIRYRPVHANAVQENAETSALSWSPTSAAYIPTCVGPHDQPVDSDSSFQDEVTRFARKYAEHLTLHRPDSRSPSPKGVPLSMVGILYTQHLLSRQLNVLFIAQQAAADYTSNLYQTASRVVLLKRTPHPQASIPDDNGIIYASLAETIRESSHEQEKRFARSKAGITALVASELDLLPPHTSVEQEGPDLQNPENGHRHVHVGQPVGGLIEDKKLRTRDYQEGLKTKEETPASCAFGEWVHERKRLNAEAIDSLQQGQKALGSLRIPRWQLSAIQRQIRQNVSDHRKWKTTLWEYVDQIRSTVYFLRVQKFSNPVQFRCAAEEVGRALMSFKAYARHEYDNLSREKASLETELEVDERKVDSCIEKWMYGTSRRENDERRASATETGREVSGLPANPKTEQQYRESVTALQTMLGALEIDLLKGGDPLGGWEATDHQAFERIIHHIGGQTGTSGLVIQLKRALPHISKDSIEAHLVWHNEHTELTTRKQELVKKYRDLKSAYAAEKSEQREAEKAEMQRIRNEDECRKAELSALAEEKTRMITEWRQRREEEMTKQREMDQDRQEGIQRKEKQRPKFRRQQLLQEQHKRKERELLSAKLEEKRSEYRRPSITKEQLERIAARNSGMIAKRKDQMETLRMQAMNTGNVGPRVIRSAGPVEIHSKVFEETVATQRRRKSIQEDIERRAQRQGSGHDAIIPLSFGETFHSRRMTATPAWRRYF